MKPKLIYILAAISLILPSSGKALLYEELISYRAPGQVLGASTNGLIGYWNFDEGSGTTAQDTSGNNKTAALTNGPAWTSGNIGSGSLGFDGTDDYVTVANFPKFNGGTYSAWVKPAALSSGSRTIFSQTAQPEINTVYQDNLNRLIVQVINSAGGLDYLIFTNFFTAAQTWTLVTVTFSGNQVDVYKNGTLFESKTNANGIQTASGTGTLNIGRVHYGGGYWNGSIDEVRIYNRALSAQEVLDVYTDTGSGIPPPPPPPAGDTTPPVVSAVSLSAVSQSTATVTWTTDEVSDTQVEYGITVSYGSTSALDSSMTTSHTAGLLGLSAGTTYHYRVKSRDAAGNLAVSIDNTFTTTAAPPLPPVVPGNYPWSTILDFTRATDWQGAGFTIPNYTVPCAVQPSLIADDPNAAAANTTAIQNALASCDTSHNVVNIPSGKYYVAGWKYGGQGRQVVRGAGPMLTTMIPTTVIGCAFWMGICMSPAVVQGNGVANVIPPTGNQQCAWTGGYEKGSTSITLSNCPGGAPSVGKLLILDQVNDSGDTGGSFICDNTSFAQCAYAPGDMNGRVVNGVTRSQQQVVSVTGASNNGDGTYTVNISKGVYFNNIRASQSPGAYWFDSVQNDGLENLTIDHSYPKTGSNGKWSTIAMLNCRQCWVKNVRSLYGPRSDIFIFHGLDTVIRDNYFYGSQGTGSQSYGIEFEVGSGILVENNIFHQVTAPIVFGQGSGNVLGYNYTINNIYQNPSPGWMLLSSASHNAGNEMNLWEGNNANGISADTLHGSSALDTYFRNMLIGWQTGKWAGTYSIHLGSWSRGFNLIGNVLGQPNYHNNYESYATTPTSGVNGGNAKVNASIYSLGWTGIAGVGGCGFPPVCDPLVRPTLMRWGNYDVVGGTKWDAAEAAPAAVPFIGPNFTPSYFGSLPQTLPASLYYNSRPYWWPAAKAWPPVGPDVSSGNLGTCSGTYAGSQAIASGQCTGGTLTAAWANHANSTPAQDCFLNTMQGPPDGSGGALSFDANSCYYGGGALPPADTTPPSPPAGVTVH